MAGRRRNRAAIEEVIDEGWMASSAYRDPEARLAQMEHNTLNKLRVGIPLVREVKRFSVARPSGSS